MTASPKAVSSQAQPGGPFPLWVAWPLWPLALLYGTLSRLRAWLYAQGWLASQRLDVPVVSVGNLTVGGSGKTPMVEWLARYTHQQGLRPVVLSRGYGRHSRATLSRLRLDEHPPTASQSHLQTLAQQLGDEPVLLARRNPWLPIYVGKRRSQTGRLAQLWDNPGVVLLDDAFGHLALQRDLNLLLIDAGRALSQGRVLPLGWLREPVSALRRADAFCLTKIQGNQAQALTHTLREHLHLTQPIFAFGYQPAGLRRLDDGLQLPLKALAGLTVGLVAAIAQPAGFIQAVQSLGATVGTQFLRPDHHAYPSATLATLDALLGQGPSHIPQWLTTEKDAVKLSTCLPRPERLWVLDMALTPPPEWEAFLAERLR